jgi:hypothetical protein
MQNVKLWSVIFIVWAAGLSAARAQQVCDAPSEEGWRVVLSNEVTGVKDGAPYRSGPDWMLDRTTTLLPLCSYFSPVGSYSLKSYSLDPFDKTERVLLCHDASPVGPYAGPCPPK